MNSYSRLLFFVRPYYKRMIFAVFCMIVAAAAYLVVPWLIKNVVDQVLQDKNMFMLNLIVGAIILIFLIRGFATYGQTYNMSYIGQRVIIDVREAIFKHLQRLSLSYFDRRKTGVIMSNLTNDVSALQSAVVDRVRYLDWFFSFHVAHRLEVNTGYIYYGTNGADYHKCVW